MSKLKNYSVSLFSIVFSILIGYLIVEVSYRLFLYHSYEKQIYQLIISRLPGNEPSKNSDYITPPLNPRIFDLYTGTRYKKNIVVGPISHPYPVFYKTNSQGLISRDEFPIKKPIGEFRIGVIGDSFTAGTTNVVRWTDVLEDRLNKNPSWKTLTKHNFTRVINFGIDGIGNIQFDDVAERIATQYSLDFLIVNMLKEDIPRRPFYLGQATEMTEIEVKNYVKDEILTKVPWFTTYPEVLSVILKPYFSTKNRLSINEVIQLDKLFTGNRFYESMDEAAQFANIANKKIVSIFPNALFLIDPTYKEYTNSTENFVNEAFEKMLKLNPKLNYIDMFPITKKPNSQTELDSWFNVPHDFHKNALGATIYGNSVADLLLNNPQILFTNVTNY